VGLGGVELEITASFGEHRSRFDSWFPYHIMSNQKDHRGPANKKNKRHNERPTFASSCGGEGHNGQKGRTKWKVLSRRSERRALKEGKIPKIKKRIKKTFSVPVHVNMLDGETHPVFGNNQGIRRKVRIPRPKIVDKISTELE
jgi:hypothetical protein